MGFGGGSRHFMLLLAVETLPVFVGLFTHNLSGSMDGRSRLLVVSHSRKLRLSVYLSNPVIYKLLVLLKVELLVVGDRRLDDLLAGEFFLGVMELGEVGMAEGLAYADPLIGVELQHSD